MFSKYFIRCLIQHKCWMSGINRKVTDFFQRKVSETTFLNDKNGGFQIYSNEEQTNRHAIDQTTDTSSCIPESLVVVVKWLSAHTHFIEHLVFNCQRRSVVTEKDRAKLTGFKNFPSCIMALGWLGCLVRKEPLKSVYRQKSCEIPMMKEFVF